MKNLSPVWFLKSPIDTEQNTTIALDHMNARTPHEALAPIDLRLRFVNLDRSSQRSQDSGWVSRHHTLPSSVSLQTESLEADTSLPQTTEATAVHATELTRLFWGARQVLAFFETSKPHRLLIERGSRVIAYLSPDDAWHVHVLTGGYLPSLTPAVAPA